MSLASSGAAYSYQSFSRKEEPDRDSAHTVVMLLVQLIAHVDGPASCHLGRVLINRQPNADLDVPPNVR